MFKDIYRGWLLILLCSLQLATSASVEQVQATVLDYMDFEVMNNEELSPQDWTFDGAGYSGYCDSTVAYNGQRSFRIEYLEPVEYSGCVFRTIPFYYEEDTITLSGCLRTEDTADNSYVGLYLVLYDKLGNPECYRNEYLSIPVDSAEWCQIEVNLENSRFGRDLELGAFLYGPGTVWVDDLELRLDDRPFSDASIRALPGAEQDHEFDYGSGLEFSELDSFQLESLVLLGKVWNFLKYHHPQIGRGDINWDYSLFRILRPVLDADTESERQQALLNLIENLEPVSARECSIPLPDDMRLSVDIDWFNDPEIGPELASALWSVYEGRVQEEHYYVRGNRHSIFNECGYENMDLPDTGFRLLALYRYWGIIEYYFPYSYAIDGEWDDILAEFIPSMIMADTHLSYLLQLQKLIVSIGDSHAKINNDPDALREFFGIYFTPLCLAYIDGQWIVDGFTHESTISAGMEIGDVITAINDRPIQERVAEMLPFINGSTEESRYYRLGQILLRGETAEVNLNIQRGSETLVITVPRMEEDSLNMNMADQPAAGDGPYTLLNDNIGYVYAGMLTRGDIEGMIDELGNTDGLILDLRDYPKDFVIYSVADFILPEETVFAHFTYPDYSNPGTFIWIEPTSAGGGDQLYSGRIAILLDEGSKSQAEFTAMAWRLAPEAHVFGSPSAGADGDVVFIQLPGGIEARITGIGVYNPDGSETQRVGILPDVYIRPTIEGMQSGHDEVFEAALEWLLYGEHIE